MNEPIHPQNNEANAERPKKLLQDIMISTTLI
ncbi:MAG: hypothetical protein ACJAWV_001769 [Flammeovirgaceae bacterium]|jgi:hypothetical protein